MIRKKKRIYKIVNICLLILLTSTYMVITIFKPVAIISPVNGNVVNHSLTNMPLNINWPSGVEAAISVDGYSFISTTGNFTPTPTASVAKLITSLVVLDKYPLSVGQQGNVLTISQNDVDIYYEYYKADGSTSPVKLNEKISQFELLESMLIPSSDNAADSLAIWAYGSLANYSVEANKYLKAHNINETTVGSDASGLSPDTVSTPSDLIKIANLVEKNPVLMQIVGMKYADLPVAGRMYNYNSLIGKDGINGIKTGNSDEAGGVLLTSSTININGKDINLLTAVMKSQNLSAAINANHNIVKQFRNNFSGSDQLNSYVASMNKYKTSWDNQTLDLSYDALPDLQSLNSTDIKLKLNIGNISYKAEAGDQVGTLEISSSIPNVTRTVKVYLSKAPKTPSYFWLLTHPF